MYRNLELEDLTIGAEVEIWRQVNQIEGLENVRGIYYVSNFGRVKSIGGKFGDRIMKQSDNSKGYLFIGLRLLDGKQKKIRVNRLVAFAFVKGYSEGFVCNHLDEDKENNHYSNLEWCTQKQNVNHGTAIKRRAEKRSMPVIGECVKTGEMIEFPSTMEAGRQGFSQGNVASCCRGERKTHKGFRWRYAS